MSASFNNSPILEINVGYSSQPQLTFLASRMYCAFLSTMAQTGVSSAHRLDKKTHQKFVWRAEDCGRNYELVKGGGGGGGAGRETFFNPVISFLL